MNILAFDTCFAACSVAVIERNGVRTTCLASGYEDMEAGHAERLMPMMREVLEAAGLTFDRVDAIGVTVGPGTFTGVRTGIAAARGLALARSLPVLGTTSLALIGARALPELGEATSEMVVCVDARKGQLYVQPFGPSAEVLQDNVLLLEANEAVLALPDARVAVGSGAEAFQRAAQAVGREVRTALPRLQPHAAYMAGLELKRLDPPRPLYLRVPDAKPQTGKSLPRSPA